MIAKHEMKPEHGTLEAYIIGFALSLVFTFIPYYLVVNHKASGTTLLAIILAFGVLQMLVQLLFFLHLGRKPRPRWQIGFLAGTVFAVLIVTCGSMIIINNLHRNMTPEDQVQRLVNDEGIAQVGGKPTGACGGEHPNHRVMIVGGKVSPRHTDTHKCDTLTFMNQSGKGIDITFTVDDNYLSYAGQSDYNIHNGQNQTITLSELGTYDFQDSKNPGTTGSFTVRQ